MTRKNFGRGQKHWINYQRSQKIRRGIYRGLTRVVGEQTARRMRDWTFPHIFGTLYHRGNGFRGEQLVDMEMCERVRRTMNAGDF